jgi:hypothetical protein
MPEADLDGELDAEMQAPAAEEKEVKKETQKAKAKIELDDKTKLLLEEIKQALTEAVGPVAPMIVKDQVDVWAQNGEPVVSRMPELIDLCSQEIDDEKLATEFIESSMKFYQDCNQLDYEEAEPEEEQQESESQADVQDTEPEAADAGEGEEVDENLLKEIQDALAHAIGPVAGIVMEDSMKRLGASGSLNKEQLCDLANILKEEIGDDKLAEEFTTRLDSCF